MEMYKRKSIDFISKPSEKSPSQCFHWISSKLFVIKIFSVVNEWNSAQMSAPQCHLVTAQL